MSIIRKTILVSGAIARLLIGAGAAALAFFALKKKKEKK